MSFGILNCRGPSAYCKKYITTDQNTAWFWELLAFFLDHTIYHFDFCDSN